MKRISTGVCLTAALLSWTWFAGSVPAAAQSTDQPNAPASGTVPPLGKPYSPAPTIPPPVPRPPSTSPFDGVTAFGQTLKDKGIYLQLTYVEDIVANVSGGLQTGTMPTGELAFGTVLDLQTIAGIRGASVHVTFDERNGYALNPIAGTQGPLQANSGPTRAIRLSELYWEQAFDKDRIDIIAGRTNPTTDFATSDISCETISSIICAQPGSWYFSNSNQAYPVSTWGARINVVAVPHVYVRAGVYDDDPSQGNADEHGFTWNTRGSAGVLVPAEVGYTTTFTDTGYPAKYDIGGYYDAASYTTPNGLSMRNRTAIYLQGQQTVWRPNATTHSLTVFGGGIMYNGGAPYWSQLYAGLLDRGPFIQRPNDTIDLIGSYYANNSSYRPNAPGQWIFELNYGYQVVPGVTIKPVAQYVVSPNNLLAPLGSKEPSNAWVVGVQVAVNFGALFRMPQFVPY